MDNFTKAGRSDDQIQVTVPCQCPSIQLLKFLQQVCKTGMVAKYFVCNLLCKTLIKEEMATNCELKIKF